MELGNTNQYLKSSSAQYINEAGVVAKSGMFISEWGDKALISGGSRALHSVERELTDSLTKKHIKWERHLFQGECSERNIELIIKKVKKNNINVLIGIGGGKSIDAAKAVAELVKIPIVTVPTIAATCSATTPVSIIYRENGEFAGEFYRTTNPNLTLVDPCVIANAPDLYLRAGIFDALAKYYEGRVLVKDVESVGLFLSLVLYLSEILYKKMKREAVAAIQLVKNKKVGKPLIEVIDLNIYLTGLIQGLGSPGFTGASAHAIHNGITKIQESHHLLHGIKVGYGIVITLYLEKRIKKEIEEVVTFFRDLGMDPSLKGLGLPYNPNTFEIISEAAHKDFLMKRCCFEVSKDMIESAIKEFEKDSELFTCKKEPVGKIG